MNKEENLKRLKQRLEDKQPVDIYLGNEYYDTFYYKNENIYQGEFGYITIKNLYFAINNLIEGMAIKEGK
jgi:hypothetical protein